MLCKTQYTVDMKQPVDTIALARRLAQELRRGSLVLATLSQLRVAKYGYSLVQELSERGLEVEQGTLYPLLRRLDEYGLLRSEWKVDGSRPRKYYALSPAGVEVLNTLSDQWYELAGTLTELMHNSSEGEDSGPD